MQICVIAKEPRPGFVKTRLSPPFSPHEAAEIAEAALADTLATVASVQARRHVLALDGDRGPWLPSGFRVIEQTGNGLGERLQAAFDACFEDLPEEPVIVIGMDTPQVTVRHILNVARLLDIDDDGPDAVIGPARDGGYWLLGLRRPVPGAFARVRMSEATTCAEQFGRLSDLGCRVVATQQLIDVDDAGSAAEVAASIPGSRFAAVIGRHSLVVPSGVC
jgi:rSAM/selenodomain-associated transferase 1